jgi:Fic family protein
LRFKFEAIMHIIRFMYIWQASTWPNFHYDLTALQPVLVRARLAQGRVLGLASSLQLLDHAQLELEGWAAEAVATAEIEGELLQVHSVRASVARRLGLPGALNVFRDARTEATLDVLQAATKQWQHPLSDENLFTWQAALFPEGRSSGVKIQTGAYRQHVQAMQIVTVKYGVPDIVHYQAPDSIDVPAQMRRLIDWFNDSAKRCDGLIRAAIAHLWFEAIHPFEDGNGRLGRALSELALAQDMQSSQRIWSLSQQIMNDRLGYYAQLQAATSSDSLDVTPWVEWFVGCIERAAHAALAQMQAAIEKTRYFSTLRDLHPALTASQLKILGKLFEAQPEGFLGDMSTSKYVNITGQSRATAYRELTELVHLGLLEQYGQGRGVRYKLVETNHAA